MNTDLMKFYDLLNRYPKFLSYWDQENNSLDQDAITSLTGLSSGEVVIRDCLLSIWSGTASDDHKIDITDLAALSADARRPLVEWLISPFWP